MAQGETLVAYSDGVTEARDRDGSLLPAGAAAGGALRIEERLPRRRRRREPAHGGIDPADVVSFIHGDVTRWAQAINDDMVSSSSSTRRTDR